jgi:hypothetical protein
VLLAGRAALAAGEEERVYFFRTLEDPSVAAGCPPGDTVRLGALVFAPRGSDGLVLAEDTDRPVGTAVGCGRLLTRTPFDTGVQNPFAMKFDLEDGTITATGTCTVTSLTFPVPDVPAPLLLLGCALHVNEDPSAGILDGAATSASVFAPASLPGYRTGSYWTIHLYVNGSFDRRRPAGDGRGSGRGGRAP